MQGRVLILAFAGFLAGCSTLTLDYPEDLKSQAKYSNGIPYVMQTKDKVLLDVGVPPDPFKPSLPASLLVTAGNMGKTPFNFGTENFTATCDGKPLKIFTYQELKAKEERDAAMLAFATALNGASATLRASQPTTTYESGNLYGSGYTPSGSYRYSGLYSGQTTTYNPAASAAASAAISANTQNQIANIAATRDANIAALQGILRTTTVMPGKAESGILQIRLPSASPRNPKTIILTARVGGQEFTFPVVCR